MEDKEIDPRMVAAIKWRQTQEGIAKRQNRHMFMSFIISLIATTSIVFLSKLAGKMSGSAFVANIILLASITILAINALALRYRQLKRNRIAENEFYQKLDDMPKPLETKPHTEIVEG